MLKRFLGLILLCILAVPAPGSHELEPLEVTIRFQGREGLRPKRLKRAASRELEALRSPPFKASRADDAAHWMQLAYLEAGYPWARVNPRIEEHDGSSVVTFHIEAGPKVRLAETTFSGNEALDRDTLEGFLGLGRDRLFMRKTPPFVRSHVDSAILAITQHYRSLGYLDVRLSAPNILVQEFEGKAYLSLDIEEGIRCLVHEVSYEGDLLEELLPDLEALRDDMLGQPYQNRLELLLKSRITEIYGDYGYPDCDVNVTFHRKPFCHEVHLVVHIEHGIQVRIDRVRIEGKKKTRTVFLQRHFFLKPGDLYSARRERETARKLHRTGIFSQVDVFLEGKEEERDLVVQVKEAPSMEAFLEPGWGSYEQARATAGLRKKNWLGHGLLLGTEGKASLVHRSVHASLESPHLWASDLSGRLDTSLLRREEPAYTRREVGWDLMSSYAWSKDLSFSTGYALRRTDLSDWEEDGLSLDREEGYSLGSIRIQWVWDTRNDVFLPSKGQRSHAVVEHAAHLWGGEVDFLRVTTGIKTFHGISPSTVLAFRAQAGLIVPGSNEVALPVAERFFNGGENSVRSFREAKLGPRDLSGNPTGGLASSVLSLEVRQRLMKSLTASLFYDLGNVAPNRSPAEREKELYTSRADLLSDTLSDFFHDFRGAIGMGLMYTLPVGPVRLDMAFNPWARQDRGEDSMAMHLSIGAAY